MTKSLEILSRYWGYSSFRPMQEEIVDSVIYGHDTLAVLSTGGGKSICFQVPGLALDGITVVISPLIALMQDQVDQLQKRGIKALHLGGNASHREIDIALDNARFGNVTFLYVSPERAKSQLFIERFKQMNVSLIAVDEAHCISEWGHDFRPAYREIKQLREHHPSAPVIALTASATKRVQEDIVQSLGLNSPKEFIGTMDRSNLHYEVRASENKMNSIVEYCKARPDHSGIIYCQTRRSVKEVVRRLRLLRLPAGFYHGGLNASDREFMLNEWLSNRIRIMVATNAFGMGIDKPDVRYVLHYEIPNNLEAYYQESGRAGRDGSAASAVAFWEPRDLLIMNDQLSSKFPPEDRIKAVYEAICNHLSISFEAGTDETYAFDFRRFSSLFDFTIQDVYHALRILQMNGTLTFEESNFLPTRLKFSIGSSALYKFQLAHDSVDALITLLTRSYPGIFDRFITIHEGKIAEKLRIDSGELRKRLEYLEQFGVIDVTYQSNSPRITLLHGRLPLDRLVLSPQSYSERKKIEQEKFNTISDYVQLDHCRQEMISNYFSGEGSPCGTCDVCKSRSTQPYTHAELLELIPTMLPASLEEIRHSTQLDLALIKRAVRSLMTEERIGYEHGKYYRL